jgi:hypothetical protein
MGTPVTRTSNLVNGKDVTWKDLPYSTRAALTFVRRRFPKM